MVIFECIQPLGASDYLEMSRLFDTIFIRHIPLLTLNKKTQARRLITLVDALYEHKVHCCYVHAPLTHSKNTKLQLFYNYFISFQVRVVILADHPLEDIFVHNGDHSHDESHILMDDLGLKRVRARTVFKAEPVFHVGWLLSVVNVDH